MTSPAYAVLLRAVAIAGARAHNAGVSGDERRQAVERGLAVLDVIVAGLGPVASIDLRAFAGVIDEGGEP